MTATHKIRTQLTIRPHILAICALIIGVSFAAPVFGSGNDEPTHAYVVMDDLHNRISPAGAVLIESVDDNDGNGNGNNGHGNNIDGVDSSNSGAGHGGPNGGDDESCDGSGECVDDEVGN